MYEQGCISSCLWIVRFMLCKIQYLFVMTPVHLRVFSPILSKSAHYLLKFELLYAITSFLNLSLLCKSLSKYRKLKNCRVIVRRGEALIFRSLKFVF